MTLWLNGVNISDEPNETENKMKFKRATFLKNAFINIFSYIKNIFYKPYWYKNNKKDDDFLFEDEYGLLNTHKNSEIEIDTTTEVIEFFNSV